MSPILRDDDGDEMDGYERWRGLRALEWGRPTELCLSTYRL